MGLQLYKASSAAREVFREADDILGFPLSRLCFQGPEEQLRQTVFAQPAIMTVSVACWRAAQELRGGELPSPSFLAGHSLGEYTALVMAGCLPFADGLRLVQERGRLMQEAADKRPGGMAAIMGLEPGQVEAICLETGLCVANLNSPQQIVISGAREPLERSMAMAKARGARLVVPLEVAGAFHSPLMEPVQEGLSRAILSLSLADPRVPIVANGTARPLTSAREVREELVFQACHCVRWQESIEYMENAGVSTFVEVGNGRVLTGLVKRIARRARLLNLDEDTLLAERVS